jgi:pimeloyl-ACP methyl ester carboxylesterase
MVPRQSIRIALRRLAQIGLAFIAGALALMCAGAIYEAVGNRVDVRRFPQRGKSFQAGPVKLNLDCTGKGDITVVLDSGMGGPALDWILVQPEVAKFTRVCSYDRAGYGWSDASFSARTSMEIAQELKSLLVAAGEKSPFVMVGHSFGGYNVRVFTSRYPKDVVGMVLVDASHPDEGERTDAVLSAAQRERQQQITKRDEMWERVTEPLKIRLGIERLRLALGLKQSRHLSRRLQEEFLYLEHMPKYLRTVRDEDSVFKTSGEQAVAAGSLGDRPLIVLTAGIPYDPDPLLTPAQMQRQNDIWIRDLQVEEMHLSSRGKQIVVPDSSHDMPQDRPDAIVAAIHDVWNAVRQERLPE